MDEKKIELVQESFGIVLNYSEKFAEKFYQILFTLKPELRQMFKGDPARRGEKLMATLKIVVMGLDNLELIKPLLENLGRGHVAYGVRIEDYDVVGKALLMTFEDWLGESFTQEVKEAWAEVYTLVANVMIRASKSL